MKQYIYILTLFIVTISYAQETVVPLENKASSERFVDYRRYFKDINNVLDKFVGTWKYESATESLEITFFKVIHNTGGNDSTDELDCDFIYIRNGVTVFNTFSMDEEDKFFIVGAYLKNPTNIMLSYEEPTSPRAWRASLFLDYIVAANGEPEKLNWFIRTFSKKTMNGQKVYPFETPYSLVLIKQ